MAQWFFNIGSDKRELTIVKRLQMQFQVKRPITMDGALNAIQNCYREDRNF